MQEVTVVPKMPQNVIGVIQLRGVITPVVDLRKALLEQETQDSGTTRIIAVNIPIGLVVDAATDVLDIPSESIQKPNFVNHDVPYLIGVAKLNHRLLILIDINHLLQNITILNGLNEFKQVI